MCSIEWLLNSIINMYIHVVDLFICFENIRKKMWYSCQWDNSPQETKWHRNKGYRSLYSFNNEQSLYRIVSYKSLQITDVKHSNKKTTGLINVQKWIINKYVKQQQRKTTELQAPDLGQALSFRMRWVKTWDSGVTVQHTYELYIQLKRLNSSDGYK